MSEIVDLYRSGNWEDHTPDKPSLHTEGALLSECCKKTLAVYPNPDEVSLGTVVRCECGRRWLVKPNEEEGHTWLSKNVEPVLLYGGIG